jgi:molybdenum-dependent DNA-binding transcriptional regulator ModE
MGDRTGCGRLRPRHIEVLRAVLEQGSATAAAHALCLSRKTVNWYMDEIHRVTGVRGGRGSHAAAVACGRALGLRVVVVDDGRTP